jgi:phospholipase/lecithinase/hemolysin
MTDAEYDALLERENLLWRELLALEAAVEAKSAEWEAAADAVTEANMREAVAERLADRVATGQRNPQGAA